MKLDFIQFLPAEYQYKTRACPSEEIVPQPFHVMMGQPTRHYFPIG